jgi:hypothetical protein
MNSVKESKTNINSTMERLEKLFSNPEQFSSENLDGMLQEMFKLLMELQDKLASSDPKVRDEAMQFLTALKAKMEVQVQNLCESMGIDSQALKSYFNTPGQFSADTWQALEKAEADLENFKESMGQTEPNVKTGHLNKIQNKKFC